MLFTRAAVVSALTLLARAQTKTTLSPAQVGPLPLQYLSHQANAASKSTKAIHDLHSYLGSLTTVPGYTAAVQAISTGIPASVLSQINNNPNAFDQSLATATADPSWFSALPTSAVAFLSSVGAAEMSIVSMDAQGPAPTNAAKVAGVVLAAGGAALAML